MIVAANKQNFKKILNQQTIWTIDEVHDEGLKEEINGIQINCYRFQRALKWSYAGALCGFYVAFSLGQRKALFGTTNCLPGLEDYWLSIIETLFLWQGIAINAAVENIFIGGCVTLVIQLKIASHVIANTNYGKGSTHPKTFVEKYNKLLE